MLLAALKDIEVFKRAHLVALAGVKDNTLKVWLGFINKAAKRQTAERFNTRFTALEAMSVVLMGELQREWGTPPEHSYTFAWHACFAFCEAKQNDLKRPLLGFPRETFTVSFSPAVVNKSRCGIGPKELGEEIADALPRECSTVMVIPDAVINDRVFKPVLALRQTITGVDLLALAARQAELEERRDDAKEPTT